MAHADILLFVEDTSAANYAALLLPELARHGWRAAVYASAVARGRLHARGVDFVEIDDAVDAPLLLRQVRPRCVLTGTAENPRTPGLRLIEAARGEGIPSVAFIDALMNAPYRFRGTTSNPLAYMPDRLLVPDAPTLDAFVALGYPAGRIAICGHPQYDRTRDLAAVWDKEGGPAALRRRLFPEVPPGRRILTFISEGSPRYVRLPRYSSSDYVFGGRGGEKGRTKILLEEVLDAIGDLSSRPYFVFRAHPTESAGDYAAYAAEIDRFSVGGSPLEVVYASDLAVGMTSMLLLEAALLGRPALAVMSREPEAGWLASVGAGVTPLARDRTALRALLRAQLDAVAPARASVDELLVWGSAERVARELAYVLSPERVPQQ